MRSSELNQITMFRIPLSHGTAGGAKILPEFTAAFTPWLASEPRTYYCAVMVRETNVGDKSALHTGAAEDLTLQSAGQT